MKRYCYALDLRDDPALIAEYEMLKPIRASGQEDTAHEIGNRITTLLGRLQVEVSRVLTTRLGDPSKGIKFDDEKRTKAMLSDLYFLVFPAFLLVIKSSTVSRSTQTSMNTTDLKEIYTLVDTLCHLARVALEQPKSHQPGPARVKNRSPSYQTLQPTRSILHDAREILSCISSELSARTRKEALIAMEVKRKEGVKRQVERSQREQVRMRRLANEIHRSQSQTLEEKLTDPVWGTITMVEIAKMEGGGPASNKGSILLGRTSSRRLSNSHTREVKDDFAYEADRKEVDERLPKEHHEYQRVKMFEKNNDIRQNRPKMWTMEDRTKFLEFLRYERGIDVPAPKNRFGRR